MNATSTNNKATGLYERWQVFSAAVVQGFHVYANWLVGISWRRFVMLSLALIIAANILQDIPPFTWRINEQVLFDEPVNPPEPPAQTAPKSQKQNGKPHISLDKPIHYEISIDDKGVRITPRKPSRATQAASAASAAASAASATAEMEVDPSLPSIAVGLPKGADTEAIRQAIEEAKQSIEESVKDAQEAAEQAAKETQQATQDAVREATRGTRKRTTVIRLGDFLVNLSVLLVLASAVSVACAALTSAWMRPL